MLLGGLSVNLKHLKIAFLKTYFFGKLLEWPWSHQKLTFVKIDQEES